MLRITILFAVVVFLLSGNVSAQNAYTFKEEVRLDATGTKDQCRTGTCWSYSTVSFIESELIRMGKGRHNLSEMFNVRVTYPKKAEMYVRYHGNYQFGPGSLCHDVINAIRQYGVVPEEVYHGLNYGAERHDHGELDAILLGMVKAVVENRSTSTGNTWMMAFNGTLDAYLGEIPETFLYLGKSYTPASLRDELGLQADDYVSITSYAHHPFWSPFVLEVPDNFSQGSFYNVPLDELEALVVNALNNGFTLAWDADVSEKGFSFREGMAILPPPGIMKDELFVTVVNEPTVTQELRQASFDNYQTTDDHLMHIVGIASDQDGRRYFIIKNSWGSGNPMNGCQYISMAYFRMHTISVLLHKEGLSKDLRKKLSI